MILAQPEILVPMKVPLAAALILLATAPLALAQTPGPGGVRAACAADIAKLCPDAQPANGSIRQCISTPHDQMSGGCKSALAAAMARRQAMQQGAPQH